MFWIIAIFFKENLKQILAQLKKEYIKFERNKKKIIVAKDLQIKERNKINKLIYIYI